MESLKDIIKSLIDELAFNNPKVVIEDRTAVFGYLSEMHNFSIEGDVHGERRVVSIVVKMKPDSAMSHLPLDVYWNIELNLYRSVFPEFDELQATVDRKFLHPRCFKLLSGKKSAIFMEDLISTGYEMCRSGKSLDYVHSKLMLEQAAYFHALSFVYKARYPGRLESFLDLKLERQALYTDFTIYLDAAVKFARKNIKDDDFIEMIDKYLAFDYKKKSEELILNDEFAVITHGDLWANNVMFKYEGDNVKSALLLDYQISFYRSPLFDLFTALFIAVDETVRETQFETLIDYYYETLSNRIKLFGETDLYPKERFMADLKIYSYVGVSQALILLPVFANSSDDVIHNDQQPEDTPFLGVPIASEMYVSRLIQTAKDIKKHGLGEWTYV